MLVLYCKVHVSFITSILEDEHELSLGMLMRVKCMHELCTITLIFQSYLHHINIILLLFNDIWKVIMIYAIYGINSALADFPEIFLFYFRGLNDVIIAPKSTGIIFLEGRRLRSEDEDETEAARHNGMGPRGPCPTSFPPRGSAAVDLSSRSFVLT